MSSVERSSGTKADAPFGSEWCRQSWPRVGLGAWWRIEGWRGSVVYEHCSKRIQLSRPRRMGCFIVPAGTMQAHTSRAAVGVVDVESECMLKRMDAEVVRGEEVPTPPQERGEACCMHASEAEWEAFRCGPPRLR